MPTLVLKNGTQIDVGVNDKRVITSVTVRPATDDPVRNFLCAFVLGTKWLGHKLK